MNIPAELKYTKSHEWVKEEDGVYTVGLTAEGDEAVAGGALADVESVKAVSDVFSPVTGTVAEVNKELPDEPQQINQAPYDAWIAKITDVTGTEELLSAEEYAALCETAKE